MRHRCITDLPARGEAPARNLTGPEILAQTQFEVIDWGDEVPDPNIPLHATHVGNARVDIVTYRAFILSDGSRCFRVAPSNRYTVPKRYC